MKFKKDKVLKNGWMDLNIKDNIKMVQKMVVVNSHGKTVLLMMEN